jgi:lipoyl(octanoyl) transferase
MSGKIKFHDLGIISYQNALNLQTELFQNKIRAKISEISLSSDVFLCEHQHVYTIGKSGDENNLLINSDFLKKINAEYYKTDRGGDITYHGPGQIVVYPIIDLDTYHLGTKDYIYLLEYMIIDVLKEFNIAGEINPGNIGVWLNVGSEYERKICSIGVKISKGITMHGLALNVNTDLSYFNYINPCGFIEKGVTSIQKETGSFHSVDLIKKRITEEIIQKLTNRLE